MTLAPQLVQYQGSKRKLAPKILENMPKSMERLVEPFSGMAAISIAVATEGGAKKYWINDLNAPLISVLESAAEAPHELCDGYKKTWDAQFTFEGGTLPTFTLSVIDTTAVTVV